MAGKKKDIAADTSKWEDVPEIPKEEQPYSLSEGWKWVYLEYGYDITSSKRIHKADWRTEGIPFYRTRELVKLSDHGFVDNDLFIEDKLYNKIKDLYGVPKINDILISGVGTIGIPWVIENENKFYFKDGNVIWLKSKNKILSKFIFYLFKSEFIKNSLKDMASGTTVDTYTIVNAKKTKIPLPPPETQQRIVNRIESLFSKLDEAAAKVQAVIDSHEARKQAILHKAFNGELTQDVVIKEENNYKDMPEIPKEEQPYPLPEGWKWVYLEYGYDITSSKRIHKTDWRTDGIPFYRTRELVKLSEYGFVDNDLFIEEKLYNEIKNIYGVPKINDILISGVGTIGIPWVIENENKFYFKDGNVIWLKSKNTIISKYIFYLFKSGFIKNSLKRMASGTTVDTYTIVNAKKTKIPLPPLEIQQRIVACIESLFSKLDKAAAKVQAVIDNHEARKQAILHKAFNGELTQDVVIKEENNYKDIPEIPKEEQPYLLPK